jgi:hypothetical protein
MTCASGSGKRNYRRGNRRNGNCLRPGTLIASAEMKHKLSIVVLVIAIVLAMTGWVYALGWVVLKLI